MKLPSDSTIQLLHRAQAPSQRAYEVIYTHCQIVADIAERLIEQNHLSLDRDVVRAAALLHDIGYYLLLDASGFISGRLGIKHGITGAALLRREGMDEAICRIAERHTGVGLSRETIRRQHLPLPDRDLVPETPEEWLVTYADKLHTKSIAADEPQATLGWFVPTEAYREHIRTYGEDLASRFDALVAQYGTPDLEALARSYGQPLQRPAGV